jgi:hypothetical protein
MMSEVDVERKVSVRPIKKAGWLPPGHDGEVRFTNTYERLTVQRESSTGMLNTGLTEEDERRLEKLLRLKEGALSKYNPEFWDNFYFNADAKGKTLDLNNPNHELEYKVMLAHSFFANSETERFDSPSARYVLTSAVEEAKIEGAKTKTRREAYKKFSNMSTQELIDIHNVINPTKKLSVASNIDLVQSAVEKIVIETPDLFLSTLGDTSFKMKAFIDKCIQAKLVVKAGPKYTLQGGERLGSTLAETLDYLNNPENQDVYISLKTKLEVKA